MNWMCDSQVMVEVRSAKDRIGEVSGWWNSPERQYAKLPSAPEAVLLANSTHPLPFWKLSLLFRQSAVLQLSQVTGAWTVGREGAPMPVTPG